MSLLTDNFEDFVLVLRTRLPDGDSGFDFSFADGETFQAHARLDDSSERDTARTKTVKNIYTVTTRRSVCLSGKNIIRRVSDGKMFRVVSDGADNKTPGGAGLDMRQVRAEEFNGISIKEKVSI